MKNLIKSVVIGAAFSFSSFVMANPSPFGLEMGKATEAQMSEKYTATFKGYNKYSSGKMFDLDTSQLGVDGLQSATLIFNEQDQLVAILTSLPKSRFDAVFGLLRNKYRVQSQQLPFVGNKRVVMKEGQTEITLDAPHMSFEMEMNYILDDFMRRFKAEQQREQQQSRQREAGNL